jgi:hypothetical protein
MLGLYMDSYICLEQYDTRPWLVGTYTGSDRDESVADLTFGIGQTEVDLLWNNRAKTDQWSL